MSNRGIREQPLDVVLNQRGDVAESHGERGRDPQQPESAWGIDRENHAQQDCECRRFGSGGHKAHHRSRSTLVNVWSPNVKGSGGNLESQTYKHQRHRVKYKQFDVTRLNLPGNDVDIRRSGGTEHECNPVKEEGGGERSEEEIFQRRLGAGSLGAAESGQNIGGNRGDFQSDKNHHQFDG